MAVSGEEKIAELEAKVRELEALTRGLTDEMLDLKSIVMRLNTRMEERKPVVQPRTPITTAQKGQVPAEKDLSLEMIIQPDGTLKPEKRTNSNVIVASGRFNPKGMKKEKEESSQPLIYATEDDAATDDSVVIKKKK